MNTAKNIVIEGGKTVTRLLKKNICIQNKAKVEKIERERFTSFTEGYSNWENANVKVQKQESSTDHRHSIKILIERNLVKGLKNSIAEKKYSEKKNYWKNVLLRGISNNKVFG